MRRCADINPEGPDRECVLPEGKHSDHYDGTDWWPDPQVQEEIARKPRKAQSGPRGRTRVSPEARRQMLDARSRTVQEGHAGAERPRGPWTEVEWLMHAQDVLTTFLASHEGPFTTAEHLWPLLEDPLPDVDRRILVRVVRQALRDGQIEECGAKRLKDTYRTRSGTTWKMNKIVPVYRSRSPL